jgi:hypothetical protein
MSEMDVALARKTRSRCQHLFPSNHGQRGQETGHIAVQQQIEVEYCGAQSENQHLAVVWVIHIQSFLSGLKGGE